MLEVPIKGLSSHWQNRLNDWVHRCQGFDPKLIKIAKELFDKVGKDSYHATSYEGPVERGDEYRATEIPPVPNTLDISAGGLVFDSKASLGHRKALEAILPKAGIKPYYNQVHAVYTFKLWALDNTDEGYFVDRCYSSTIDTEGMQLIDRLITVCAQDVRDGGVGNIPQEVYREHLDIPVLMFFVRIACNKETEVCYKLALQRNPFPKENKAMHDHWDHWVRTYGYPHRFGVPPDEVVMRIFCGAPLGRPPGWEQWRHNQRVETYKQLKEAWNEDMKARAIDPQAPLAHLTYNCWIEKQFVRKMVRKVIRVASTVLGLLGGVYCLYRYGHVLQPLVARFQNIISIKYSRYWCALKKLWQIKFFAYDCPFLYHALASTLLAQVCRLSYEPAKSLGFLATTS
jgi:hypothetical protein